jgi:hypothetical protein
MLALLASSQGLLVQPPPKAELAMASRRSVLSGALASVAFAAAPALAEQTDIAKQFAAGSLSKDELYALAAERKEAERITQLPVNRLKRLRDQLATSEQLIDAGNWEELREVIRLSTTSELISAVNAGGLGKTDEGKILVTKVRKAVYNIDLVAFGTQSVFGDALSGYCAQGVVPRDEKGGCKMRPAIDKAALMVDLKKALDAFDKIIKLV